MLSLRGSVIFQLLPRIGQVTALVLLATVGSVDAAVIIPGFVDVRTNKPVANPQNPPGFLLQQADPLWEALVECSNSRQRVSLDFAWFARRRYATINDPVAKLTKTRMRALSRNYEILHRGGPEQPLVSPALYASSSRGVHSEEVVPYLWREGFDKYARLIQAVTASVGRVDIRDVQRLDLTDPQTRRSGWRMSLGTIAGTACMVSDDMALTAAHVAKSFCDFDPKQNRYELKKGPLGDDLSVFVNFAGGRGEVPNEYQVSDIVFVGGVEGAERDIALLRLSGLNGKKTLPPPLELQLQPVALGRGRPVFVCGFPTYDPEDKRIRQGPDRFIALLGVKRISPGWVQPTRDSKMLSHWCTTLEGSSGSPVVDFETGRVLGVHTGYDSSLNTNIAESSSRTLADSHIAELLGYSDEVKLTQTPTRNSPVDEFAVPRRPAIQLCGDGWRHSDEHPSNWFEQDSPSHQLVRGTALSVGRIEVDHLRYSVAGTAFVVADGLACTNRHVVEMFSKKVQGQWKFVDWNDRALNPSLNFGATACREHRRLSASILAVEFVSEVADVALIRFETSELELAPTPLELAFKEQPVASDPLFVVSFPFPDARNEPNLVRFLVPPPYGVKRVSPGRVLDSDQFQSELSSVEKQLPTALHHDCTTLGGSSGSPIVSLSSGKVIGIHAGGLALSRNFAIPVRALVETDKEFSEVLARYLSAGGPP